MISVSHDPSRPVWYLDEVAHAGPEHLDPAYVASYDAKAGFDPADELARLRQLGLNASSTLVDLGAGSGVLALAAAPHCRRVVAVDVSPAMQAALTRRRAELGLANVEVVQAGFLSYAHTGTPADFVFSRHALHQLPDFWKVIALRRIASILKPGGVLRVRDLFLSCPPAEVEAVVEAWLAGAATDTAAGWTRPELEAHLQTEHSTFTWLFEPMLVQTGFEIRETTYSPSRTYASYTCVRST